MFVHVIFQSCKNVLLTFFSFEVLFCLNDSNPIYYNSINPLLLELSIKGNLPFFSFIFIRFFSRFLNFIKEKKNPKNLNFRDLKNN